MRIEIWCDGSCEPNPGEAGYAAVLLAYDNEGQLLKHSVKHGYSQHSTNNKAEIMAAIIGLQALTRPSEVTVYSDSQYLIQCMNGEWGIKKNQDEFRVLHEIAKNHTVRWEWVRGHVGNIRNEEAHNAAVRAMRCKGVMPK